MEFKYVIILISLALMAFLLVKEVRRNDKSRLKWRVLASIFMMVSFVLLIIPITYTIKREEPAHELSILTEGTSPETITAIKGTKYDLDSTLFPKHKNLKIAHLADLNYHLKVHPEIKKINVYGYGFSDDELRKLKGYKISFHPAGSPSGIISASWPKKLSVSEQLIVQGMYHNPSSKDIKLKLLGLGADLDSLLIKPKTKVKFSFHNQPKQIGKAVFTLSAVQGSDTLVIEPIPFEVQSRVPVRVLILASFPDFEYKFLKKWLYENQYPVAFRSRISKDKYSTEFLNMKAVNLNQINPALLKDIDVVISDEEELSPQIFSAVNNGMGLIVRAHNLPLTQAENHQPLMRDEKGKITVDSRLSGMGKIVSTALISTYEWQLAGKKANYTRFWSLLFEKSLRKKVDANDFSIVPQWPLVGQKTRLTISGSDYKRPSIFVDGAKIAPRQNMELPFVWDGFFWPNVAGWTNLSVNQKTENIYIYEKGNWNSVKNFNKIKATTNFSNNKSNIEVKEDKIEFLSSEEVNIWWFFIIFLLTISFLWYEQRFLANK